MSVATAEEERLLLVVGLPVLAEIRLWEIQDKSVFVTTSKHVADTGTMDGIFVGVGAMQMHAVQLMISLGLLECPNPEVLKHVRTTQYGRTFVGNCANTIVLGVV